MNHFPTYTDSTQSPGFSGDGHTYANSGYQAILFLIFSRVLGMRLNVLFLSFFHNSSSLLFPPPPPPSAVGLMFLFGFLLLILSAIMFFFGANAVKSCNAIEFPNYELYVRVCDSC